VLPAYDEALKLIARDSRLLKEEAQTLRTSIAELEKSPDRDDTELDALMERLEILDIQSEVNLPSVRWKCANGLGMGFIFLHGIRAQAVSFQLTGPILHTDICWNRGGETKGPLTCWSVNVVRNDSLSDRDHVVDGTPASNACHSGRAAISPPVSGYEGYISYASSRESDTPSALEASI
jgi:hypothetical protein